MTSHEYDYQNSVRALTEFYNWGFHGNLMLWIMLPAEETSANVWWDSSKLTLFYTTDYTLLNLRQMSSDISTQSP